VVTISIALDGQPTLPPLNYQIDPIGTCFPLRRDSIAGRDKPLNHLPLQFRLHATFPFVDSPHQRGGILGVLYQQAP